MTSNDENDKFNLMDSLSLFIKKCNYFDTLEGTFIINYIINQIDKSSFAEELSLIRWTLRLIETLTIVPDMSEMAASTQAWMYHIDSYNVGILIGKLGKIATQLYMSGWIDFFVNWHLGKTHSKFKSLF